MSRSATPSTNSVSDRQFMVILAIVVATGLMIGLVAFRVHGSPAQGAGIAAGSAAKVPYGGPTPSAADDNPAVAPPASEVGTAHDGEPPVTTDDAPELQGPVNGDPAGTVTSSAPPQASTVAPAGDSSPQ